MALGARQRQSAGVPLLLAVRPYSASQRGGLKLPAACKARGRAAELGMAAHYRMTWA